MSESPVGGARRALTGALQNLTDGQRWTIGLALLVTLLFVTFGLRRAPPSTLPFAAAATAPAAAAPGSPAAAAPESAEGAVVDAEPFDPSTPSVSAQAPSQSQALSSAPSADGSAVDATEVAPVAPSSPSVVAVARTDESAIADVFLSELEGVRVVELEAASAAVCEGGPNLLVLASEGLPADVRDCVVDAGGVLVSHDDLGSSDGVLSTALGATASLVEAARVVGPDHVVGLVAGPEHASQVDAAKAALEAEGFTVRSAVVQPGDRAGATSAMLRFLVDDVETVVLGTSVADQNLWLSLAATLRTSFDHVVADVADSITNEHYPELAGGLRAVAATRVSWFARDHGETDAQRRCRERFESATGAEVSSSGELARVHLWCQHVALAERILDAGTTDLSFDSPMTSPLTSGTETGFGPRDVAVLEWKPDCSCWSETAGFVARRGAS